MSNKASGSATSKLVVLPLVGTGIVALTVAVIVNDSAARAAAAQDWSPFVLVAGLLLVGLVADDDGLFAFVGNRLASFSPNGFVLFAGATLTIATVTAVLNLDTSVAFLTPILIYAARNRGGGEAPLLYGCLLLSNASSLFLPGSNLTNLIVLGHLHLTGATFFSHMWEPALAALVVTAVVIAVAERRELQLSSTASVVAERPVWGVGIVAVVASTVLMLVLASPAAAVFGVGIVSVVIRIGRGRDTVSRVLESSGAHLLVGLFGIAVALGTLGRLWSGPTNLLSHLNDWATSGVAAVAAVLFNNLPAASLLAAKTPSHPFALLVGLNLGPNLMVTGSLAWLLWFRVAQRTGTTPSLRRASRMGVVAVPLSMAAALGILTAKGLG
jgi:arsenical pump membrane protein